MRAGSKNENEVYLFSVNFVYFDNPGTDKGHCKKSFFSFLDGTAFE
jgi:hypothetical protein